MSLSFADLPLRPELLEAIQRIGYEEMTPIQAQALPFILDQKDVIGQAQTGSGKTAAFGLGLLQNVDNTVVTTQALVLCPTRELADQVAEALRRLAHRLPNTTVTSLCGGRASRPQQVALERGIHVVVGTPGRISDHIRRGNLDVSGLKTLVLDEADRMLDMGFVDEVSGIVDQCPADRQTLLFSATLPEAIETLSGATQREPTLIRVGPARSPADIVQHVVHCATNQRHNVVCSLLSLHQPDSALIFCHTRQDCETLAETLYRRGASVLALHGGMEQRDRAEVLLQFSNGSKRFLVATDVAARGLDIAELPMVIVAEIASDPEQHVHRVGRTGRAGAAGLAFSVVASDHEKRRLERVEAYIGTSIPVAETPQRPEQPTFVEAQYRTLLILSGRQQKIRKGDVLGALVKDGGIPPESIGSIDLQRSACSVAIDRAHAADAMRYLKTGRIKNGRVRARLL